jgi:biopolymer transport protein ExbB/TolQ
MSAALRLYEQLSEATDDKTRARLIAEAFDALEDRFPQISDLATQGHVREGELRLQKEIKEVEGRLQQEIKALDLKIAEVEGRLQKEMAEVEGRLRKDLEQIRLETKQVEVNLLRAMNAQTRWLLGGLAVLGVVLKLADVILG